MKMTDDEKEQLEYRLWCLERLIDRIYYDVCGGKAMYPPGFCCIRNRHFDIKKELEEDENRCL